MEVGKFNAMDVIREAWRQLQGNKRTYVFMALTAGAIGAVVVFLAAGVLPTSQIEALPGESGDVIEAETDLGVAYRMFGLPWGGADQAADSWLLQVVAAAIPALFAGALAAFALRCAAGFDVRYRMLFEYFRYFPTFLVLGLAAVAAMLVFSSLGGFLATLAALFGGALFGFVKFFVVDRSAGVFDALRGSLRIVSANPGQTVLLHVVVLLLSTAIATPLLLATVLSAPIFLSLALSLALLIASLLVAALTDVALACAFKAAVGMHIAQDGPRRR